MTRGSRRTALALLVGALVVVAGGCGERGEGRPAGDPATAEVTRSSGGLARLADVAVRVPAGAVRDGGELSVQQLEDVTLPETLAGQVRDRSQPIRVALDAKLRRPARLRFDVSRARRGTQFIVLTREGNEDWHAVRARRDGDALIVRTRHFSDWWKIEFSPRDVARGARHRTATALGLRQDAPDCERTADGTSLAMKPSGSDALWPCLSRHDDGLRLRLASNRSVALDVTAPDGWRVTRKKGGSIGEEAWAAVSAAMREHGLPADPPMLPAGGELTLESDTDAPAKITVRANNTGLTFDAMLEGFAAAYAGAKGAKASAAELSKLAVCVRSVWTGEVSEAVSTVVDLFADCGATVFKEGTKAFFGALATGTAKTVSGLVDSVADVFGGGSSASLLINGYDDSPRRGRPVRPPVKDVALPRCRDWILMDGPTADAALRTMQDAHHDEASIGTARLSVGIYCKLNPGRTIDGVYSPSSRSPEPGGGAGPLPTCAEWREMDDAAADAALERMMAQHGDTSLSTARLSVSAFCGLYPGRRIDGVYGGSG